MSLTLTFPNYFMTCLCNNLHMPFYNATSFVSYIHIYTLYIYIKNVNIYTVYVYISVRIFNRTLMPDTILCVSSSICRILSIYYRTREDGKLWRITGGSSNNNSSSIIPCTNKHMDFPPTEKIYYSVPFSSCTKIVI